jgi:predicted tellurium resistance membrane protein TerC
VAALFIGTGLVQSWNVALTIFNMGLSARSWRSA